MKAPHEIASILAISAAQAARHIVEVGGDPAHRRYRYWYCHIAKPLAGRSRSN